MTTTRLLPVTITDRNPIADDPQNGRAKIYTLHTLAEAAERGNTERSVFEMVQITGTVVTTGKVQGAPAAGK